jgi:glycosyltransferase involved in cell wall biosynthesis
MASMKEPQPLLSIVIPVYNCEIYIENLFTSIVDDKRLEVVIVNDGSSDTSMEIVSKIIRRYKQTSFWLKNKEENTGVSICRNIGIEYSSGIFITFVDADDKLSNINELLEDLSTKNKLENKIYLLKHVEVERKSKRILNRQHYMSDVNSNQRLKDFLSGRDRKRDATTVWGKIYPARLLKDSNVRFEIDLNTWEDFIFIWKIINYANATELITSVRGTYIYYVNTPGCSLTSTAEIKPKAVRLAEKTLEEFLDHGEGLKSTKTLIDYGLNDMIFIHIIRKLRTLEQDKIKIVGEGIRYCNQYYEILCPVNLRQLGMFIRDGRPSLAFTVYVKSKKLFAIVAILKGLHRETKINLSRRATRPWSST